MSDEDDSYYTAESEDYFTAEDDDDDWLYELGFVLWVSRDGTPWYLSYREGPDCNIKDNVINTFLKDTKKY